MRSLPDDTREALEYADTFFKTGSNGFRQGLAFTSGSRTAKLVSMQLRSGKRRLGARPEAGGAVFVVNKGASGRQRKVWHGATVSGMAPRPPPPEAPLNPV